MTPERWRLMEEIFHSALEYEQDNRRAYLMEVCGEDLSLQLEVESLIKNSERAKAENFLKIPIIKLSEI